MTNKIKLRHFLGTPKYKSKAIGKKANKNTRLLNTKAPYLPYLIRQKVD